MQKNQFPKVIATMVLCGGLWSGAVLAGGAKAGSDCARPTPGVSLCGKVDTALSTCVQDRACEKKAGKKKRGKGGFGFLSRLFI